MSAYYQVGTVVGIDGGKVVTITVADDDDSYLVISEDGDEFPIDISDITSVEG